jgi:phage shock protein PspC (stress-responsive transcriptional regulator)
MSRGPLRRSRSNRVVAGVVGGLAEYVGISPNLARAIYVALSLISAAFPGLIVYVVLWILLPENLFE